MASRRLTTETHQCIRVEERAFDIHLRASGKNRIAVLGHEPRNVCRHPIPAQAGHHRAETLRNFQQLRRSISTNVVERVKLECQKIEADFCASNVFEKSIHPRAIPGSVSPCEQLVFETLQARASNLQ